MIAVPFAGCVMALIVIGPPSTFMSLASTGISVAAASSATVASSSTATGRSSTQVTVTLTVAVAPPNRVYVKVSAGPPGLLQ